MPDTVNNLRYMTNGVYNSRLNSENIYLAIRDLIFQMNYLLKKRYFGTVENNSFKKVNILGKQKKVSLGFPILIKADIGEIYSRLIENSIVNSKKRPISKSSLLRLDA
jgi:hypothetical protein